jgi:hypothetical protein
VVIDLQSTNANSPLLALLWSLPYSQDHWISDIIIFSGKHGIVMNGGAAVISNSHIYNGGEDALVLAGHAIRVLGCYFDFNNVVVLTPAVAIDISHNMFLGGAFVEIRSTGTNKQNGKETPSSGLHVTHNQFVLGNAKSAGPWEAVVLNTTAGACSLCVIVTPCDCDLPDASMSSTGALGAFSHTLIRDNPTPPATYGTFQGQSMHARSTVVTKTLHQTNSSRWVYDFSEEYAFNDRGGLVSILSVQPDSTDSSFPVAVYRGCNDPPTCQTFVIETSVVFSGVVAVSATQGVAFAVPV